MITFAEVQQYISKRYNLDAATATETTKQIINDITTQHRPLKCLADIGEYLDYLESLSFEYPGL